MKSFGSYIRQARYPSHRREGITMHSKLREPWHILEDQIKGMLENEKFPSFPSLIE